MGVVEVAAAAALVAIMVAGGIAAVGGKPGATRLLSVAGILLLAVMAIHRGDAALLTGITGILQP